MTDLYDLLTAAALCGKGGGSQLIVENGRVVNSGDTYIITDSLDTSDDFEITICVMAGQNDLSSSNVYLMGGKTSERGSIMLTMKKEDSGDISMLAIIFYGDHSWASNYSISDTGSFVADGETLNFIRFKKNGTEFTLQHCTDGINYQVLGAETLDPEVVGSSDDGLRFGNSGTWSGAVFPSTGTAYINLFNSCLKINGETVWGRSID